MIAFHNILQTTEEQQNTAKSLFMSIYITLDATPVVTPVMKAWPWNERQHDLGALMDDALPCLMALLSGELLTYDSSHSEGGGIDGMIIEWSLRLLLLFQEAVNKPNIWHHIDPCIWHFKDSKARSVSVRNTGPIRIGEEIVQWAYADGTWGKFISISAK